MRTLWIIYYSYYSRKNLNALLLKTLRRYTQILNLSYKNIFLKKVFMWTKIATELLYLNYYLRLYNRKSNIRG